ncbi:MAG: hypothetical protein ACE5KS_06445, partial [Woeseiaceae bacterium]
MMRKAANFLIPVSLITLYYAFWLAVTVLIFMQFPAIREFFPIGGISELSAGGGDRFEPIYSGIKDTVFSPHGSIRLACAMVGAAVLIIP